MNQAPIIIAGFGRSGTTWLSDIISKAIGGLILFEPFHPGVYAESEDLCYSTSLDSLEGLLKHITEKSTHAPSKNKWLLRNHLNTPLQENSQSFVEYIWNNAEVLGFKTIRANHLLGELSKAINGQVVYIYRHPLAVLMSTVNRKRFWDEYGWEWHNQYFFERALYHPYWTNSQTKELRRFRTSVISDKKMTILLMWSMSFIISLKEVEKSNGIIISYEDLYIDPYKETMVILERIGYVGPKLHPSYFFTPSLTTMNTIHNRKELLNSGVDFLDELFWKNKLNDQKTKQYLSFINEVLSLDKNVLELAKDKRYV